VLHLTEYSSCHAYGMCHTDSKNSECERYPTNARKQFLLCLFIPLHVSASRYHLQGVTVFLFISYSRLFAFRVGQGEFRPRQTRQLPRAVDLKGWFLFLVVVKC
jgi:hypothetical protein